MSEIRCPNCNVIINKRDIKRNKCWNCGNPTLTEDIAKTQEKEKRRQEKEKQASLEQKEKEKRRQEKEKQASLEKTAAERKELENRTLTEKYSFLTLFQFFVGLSMIIYTYFFITAIIDILENSKRLKDIEIDWYAMVIPYFLFLFYSICIISIVNFLFNLDNNKSDKK